MLFNMPELMTIFVYVGALYGLLSAILRKPILSALINPHKGLCLSAAFSTILFGYGLLRWEVKSSDPKAALAELATLVKAERTPPNVMMAAFSLIIGFVVVGMVTYCQFFYHRDPRTFRTPKDRAKAMRHYTRLRGGMDYAVLYRISKQDPNQIEILAESEATASIAERIQEVTHGTVAEQIAAWRATALRIHQSMPMLNQVVELGRQGGNVRILFDVSYGGYIFRYLRRECDDGPDIQILFGATLNQAEIDSHRFLEQYELLMAALRHIERQIRLT